jgi:hypothetical protein
LIQCREFHFRKPNVRDLVGAAYWVLVGALVVPALYFTLFYPGPAYLLLIPIAMGIVGVLLTGIRNVWALLIGYGGSGIEAVICESIPGQLIVAAAVFWGITILGLLLWIATRRLIEAGSVVANR